MEGLALCRGEGQTKVSFIDIRIFWESLGLKRGKRVLGLSHAALNPPLPGLCSLCSLMVLGSGRRGLGGSLVPPLSGTTGERARLLSPKKMNVALGGPAASKWVREGTATQRWAQEGHWGDQREVKANTTTRDRAR